MKTRVTLLVMAGVLANTVAASAQPAAGIPTGVWEGAISGPEMGTSECVITTGVHVEKVDASTSPSASPRSTESRHDSRSNFAGQLPSGFMLDRTGQIIQSR